MIVPTPKSILLLLTLCLALQARAQVGKRIHHVKDSTTQSPIPDCFIHYTDKNSKRQVTSTSGDGSFYIATNISKVTVTHIGYEPAIVNRHQLAANQTIYLKAKSAQLDSVTVYSAFSQTNKGNAYRYTPIQAASSISIIGEPDVLRHISSLPSVSQGIEGTLGLFVRGGNNGSNGIYFNDVPMYVLSHLMGLFSVFPGDMVKETTFYTGGLPSVKGNLSSSLLDISLKQQYGAKFNGKFTLSPYMSGIYSSIPLAKNKASLQVSGRTAFLPYLLNLFTSEEDKMDIQIHDITAALDYRISDKHFLDAMFYTTNDYFDYQHDNSLSAQNWRSSIGKLGWKALASEKLTFYLWSYYNTTYSAQKDIKYADNSDKRKSQLGVSSGLDEFAVNSKFSYFMGDQIYLNAGVTYQHQTFRPANQKFVVSSTDLNNKEIKRSNLLSAYAEVNYQLYDLATFKLGYRHTLQKGDSSSNANFDVHFLSHLYLNDNFGVEVTFDRLNQYYHILEGLPTGWSMNIMVPSSAKHPSEQTHQFYSGVFWKKNTKNMALNVSLGGYYRKMKNLVTYISSTNAFGLNNNSWEEDIDLGKGKSYGLELSSSVQASNFGATLAYTLSKSDRTFEKVNNGKTFPFKFDRRHIVNLQSKFTLSKHTTSKGISAEHILNTVFSYSTGNRTTLPIASYQGEAPPYWDQRYVGQQFPNEFYDNIYDRQLMSAKNGIKMKDYLRIDAAYTYKRKGKKRTNEFSFSIFNILNRRNAYTYFYENNEWNQLSIMPIMPTIRWTYSW